MGRPIYESFLDDPLCQAVEAAHSAGILVVVAAGNEGRDNSHNAMGYGTINAPGNDPFVITVGAMKAEGTSNKIDDRIASYSSKGRRLWTTSSSRTWWRPAISSLPCAYQAARWIPVIRVTVSARLFTAAPQMVHLSTSR